MSTRAGIGAGSSYHLVVSSLILAATLAVAVADAQAVPFTWADLSSPNGFVELSADNTIFTITMRSSVTASQGQLEGDETAFGPRIINPVHVRVTGPPGSAVPFRLEGDVRLDANVSVPPQGAGRAQARGGIFENRGAITPTVAQALSFTEMNVESPSLNPLVASVERTSTGVATRSFLGYNTEQPLQEQLGNYAIPGSGMVVPLDLESSAFARPHFIGGAASVTVNATLVFRGTLLNAHAVSVVPASEPSPLLVAALSGGALVLARWSQCRRRGRRLFPRRGRSRRIPLP
jgi:hypothetical protein